MTVTRYKKQPPASELIRESVMGVINHAPKAPAEPAKPAEPAPVAQRAPLAPIKINPGVRARIRGRRMRQAMADEQNSIFGQITSINPFQAYNPPPGVLPPGREPALAMDSDLAGWASDTFSSAMSLSGGFGAVFAEGLAFLGYAYLSELTLRPEYRRMGERIGTEMTRKWIRLTIASEGEDDTDEDDTGKKVAQDKAPTSKISIAAERTPQEEDEEAAAEKQRPKPKPVEASPEQKARERKLRKINERMKQLDVRGRFKQIGEYDCWMGRSHLYIDTGDGDKPDELLTDLGDGANDVSKRKFKKGSFKALKHIEPVWCYPVRYNATDPLADDWYRPDVWFAMQKQIHRSRLLTFVGREVPDLLKPAYAFGGLSLSQMAKPYVDNWLRTRQAVTDLIESFSVSGIYTNAQSLLQGGGEEVVDRIEMFAETRQNLGSMVLDKETEEFFNVSTPLGTLDALQAQSQEQLSSVSGIPLIVLLGITPTGLNASSEGELRVFYDLINAMQEALWRYKLQTVINFVQLDLYGEVDPAIGFEFEPLWSLDEKGQAEVRKIEAETHTIYVDLGAIGQGEVRSVIVSDENSPYNGLPPEDLPDLAEEEEEGLVVKGGKTQGGEGGEGDDDGGGASDAVIPFVHTAWDEFNEADHPRAPDGKFGAGGSGPAIKMSNLKQEGGKLGSNEGGTFTDKSGRKFYIKKPKTKAHVENELAAARLYQLAGSKTLKYRDVEGSEHVATEWQKLDKNNISKFTPTERKEAAKDFAVHAWLSNWDAAGLGGDNQGILNGEPTTLDVGGSLRFRAQGGPKGGAFGNKVTEIDTLRNKSMNPDAAGLFGKMSDAEIKSSIERVTSIPNAKIREAIGDDEDLANTLIERKRDMAKRFGIAMDSDIDAVETSLDVWAMDDAPFDESKHKRDQDGKFSTTGGGAAGGAGEAAAAAKNLFKTKKEHIAHLLTKGTTPKELMTEMGWPSVSMPAQAKSLGMKLEKYTEGGVTKYKGTPMTESEKALAKSAEAAKAKAPKEAPKLAEPFSSEYKAPADYAEFKAQVEGYLKKGDPDTATQLLKYNPAWGEQLLGEKVAAQKAAAEKIEKATKSEAPKATPEELKKAQKNTPVPLNSSDPDAVAAIKEFNEKYAGKTPTDLNQKVQDYKDLLGFVKAKENEAIQKSNAALKEKEQAAKVLAEKQAKEKADLADKFAADPELKTHYEAMEALFGGGKTSENYIANAQAKVNNAGLKGVMTGAGAAPIIAYSGSHYGPVNSELRSGTMTMPQYKFMKSLNAGLDKLPKYEKTTYRKASLTPDQVASYKVGHVVEERGFTSTSKNQAVWSGSHQFIVHGRNGRDISKLSSHQSEAEVLFKSGSRFHVKSINGQTIELEEI